MKKNLILFLLFLALVLVSEALPFGQSPVKSKEKKWNIKINSNIPTIS